LTGPNGPSGQASLKAGAFHFTPISALLHHQNARRPFKTELIADRIWQTRSQLELAILAYVGWFNHQRLHESLGDIPPAEHEALHEFRYAAATR